MDATATTSKAAVCAMVVLVLLKEGAYATLLVPAPLQDRARTGPGPPYLLPRHPLLHLGNLP